MRQKTNFNEKLKESVFFTLVEVKMMKLVEEELYQNKVN